MFDHVFVVQTSNYRWVLGHWVRELRKRIPGKTLIWWVPISFSKNNFINDIIKIAPLPVSRNYYFPFPTVFINYYKRYPNTLRNRSVVLYTHATDQLGSLENQVHYLSFAKCVHFMCTTDRDRLVTAGLDSEKTRVVFGAIDVDCVQNLLYPKVPNTVLLSSRFGPRKGYELLPDIVEYLPNWKFTILGPDWEKFLQSSGLNKKQNLIHTNWSRKNRNLLMSENQIFLSLSSLEGGPIPLIDAMAFGMYPIATDTGFAHDIIAKGGIGKLLKIPTSSEAVVKAIEEAQPNSNKSISVVSCLTWDKLARDYVEDSNR